MDFSYRQDLLKKFSLGTIIIFVAILSAYLGGRSSPRQAAAEGTASQNTYIPFIPNRFDPNGPEPIFGVQLYGSSSNTSPYYNALRSSGANWLRIDLHWSLIEPTNTTPANYNWAPADQAVAAARKELGGLKVIATLRFNPDWAATNENGVIDKVSFAEFAQFAQAVVERYDGDGVNDAPGQPVVRYFEIYNEPDGASDVVIPGWGDNGADYARLLQTIYPAMKQASPQAKVVFGGIAYDGFKDQGGNFTRNFLSDVLAAGAGPYFDIMNFHSYPAFYLNWATNPPGLYEKAVAIRAHLFAFGVSKPLMVTEAGWHSNNPPNAPGSPEIQARYVAELFAQSMAAGVETMIWWMLHDPGGGYPYDNGLVTRDTVPQDKPAMTAFKNTVARLRTARFTRVMSAAELGASDLAGYQFDNVVYNHTMRVVWVNPVNSAVVRNIRVPGAQATVYNLYGSKTTVTDAADGVVDGMLTIQVTAQPKFIEVSK